MSERRPLVGTVDKERSGGNFCLATSLVCVLFGLPIILVIISLFLIAKEEALIATAKYQAQFRCEHNANWTPNGCDWMRSTSSAHNYSNYAVASGSTECSRVGAELLRQRSTAIEAAIGIAFCEGLYLPNLTGLGATFFAVQYSAKSQIVNRTNARGWTSLNWRPTSHESQPHPGGSKISMPTMLVGLHRMYLSQPYSRLSWAELVQPSVSVCETGGPICNEALNAAFLRFSRPLQREIDDWVTNPTTNDYWQDGDKIPCGKLTSTLRALRDCPDTWWRGSLGTEVAQDLKDLGSHISLQELKNSYKKIRIEEVAPSATLITGAGERKIFTTGSDGGGDLLSHMVELLQEADEENPKTEAEKIHRELEIMKFAFTQRFALPDPGIVTEKRKVFTIPKTAQEPNFYGKLLERLPKFSGTSHFSVISEEGNAVAFTSSLNSYFGSQLRGPRTGILFNDDLSYYALSSTNRTSGETLSQTTTRSWITTASQDNKMLENAPGRITPSFMTPVIVTDEALNLTLVTGASGSEKIPTTLVQTLTNHYIDNTEFVETIDAARYHQGYPTLETEYESFASAEVLKSLHDNFGQQLEAVPHDMLSVTHSVMKRTANEVTEGQPLLLAVSDRRKGGNPAGQ